MANFSRVTAVAVALLPGMLVVAACNKSGDTAADAGAAAAASTPDSAVAAVTTASAAATADAAAPAPATTTAVAAHATGACGAHQTAYYGTGGTTLCETSCSTDNDCKLPATCWGTGNLKNTDGSQGATEKYCREPPPDNVCKPHQAAFYGAKGAKACETFCTTDADCASAPGTTCKNAGQLLNGDGTMGQAHHYCFK